jgi:DNA replication protein DnaC
MQRHELIDLLKELKLYGMVSAYDETVTLGIKRQQPIPEIIGGLCQAEAAERKVRSIRYQMGVARFPVAKDLDSFKFANSPVNEPLIRDLYSGHFLEQARNLIFIGGTGTGKTHLSIAVASHCIKTGQRGRFFSVIDLVNQLEQEKEQGKAGMLASRLGNVHFVVLDELGYLRLVVNSGHQINHAAFCIL